MQRRLQCDIDEDECRYLQEAGMKRPIQLWQIPTNLNKSTSEKKSHDLSVIPTHKRNHRANIVDSTVNILLYTLPYRQQQLKYMPYPFFRTTHKKIANAALDQQLD